MIKAATLLLLIGFILLTGPMDSSAQGTAFTYQGQLMTNGMPITGNYDFAFSLCSSSTGNTYLIPAITNSDISVTNGLFTTELDFGQVFNGNTRWLEISVRTNGSSTFTTLAPRQQLTPTPYAITASNALTAVTITGPVPNAELSGNYTGQLTLTNASNLLGGSFSGNGAGLTNLSPANLSSGTAGISINGNATTATTATNLIGNVTAAQLPANVDYLNGTNELTGTNTFAGVVNATNVNNVVNGSFTGNGGGLTNLSPANLSAGTAGISISGNATTATTATNLIGNVTAAQLPANVDYLNGTNELTGTNTFAGVVNATNVNNIMNGSFTGNGGGLTNLSPANLSAGTAGISISGNATTATTATTATNLIGNVTAAQLPVNVAYLNGTNIFTGTNTFSGVVNATNVNNVVNGSFTGNGGGLTNMSPANLSAGTAGISISGNAATATTATNLIGNVTAAQLPVNVDYLYGTNELTGTNTFAGVVNATNVNNTINGSFIGNGGGLTNLPFAGTFSFTNGYLTFTQNPDGSTNVTFIFTNGTPGEFGAQPTNSNLTVLASNNGGGLTNDLRNLAVYVHCNYSVSAAEVTEMQTTNIVYYVDTTASNILFTFPPVPVSGNVTFSIVNFGTNTITLTNQPGSTFEIADGYSGVCTNTATMGGYFDKVMVWQNFNSTNWVQLANHRTVQEIQDIAAASAGIANEVGGNLTVNSNLTVNGIISGNGSGLLNLNASELTGGSVPDAILSRNVALLDQVNTFQNTNNFTNVIIATNQFNQLSGTLNGNVMGTLSGSNVTIANLEVTNFSLFGPGTNTETNVVINGTYPYMLGNGEWYSTPVPFVRPMGTNLGIAFDVMPNSNSSTNQLPVWIDICSSDFYINSTVVGSGEDLHLQKDANGDGHITMNKIGTATGVAYRNLHLQDASSTENVYIGVNNNIQLIQSSPGNGDIPSGAEVIEGFPNMLALKVTGNTSGILLTYENSNQLDQSAVEITNTPVLYGGTLKLMKEGGWVLSGAGTNMFVGMISVSNGIGSSLSNLLAPTSIGITSGVICNFTNPINQNIDVGWAGGSGVQVGVNGSSWPNNGYVELQPREYVSFTNTTAPTASWKPF